MTDQTPSPAHRITSVEALEALYEAPKQLALDKEIGHITPHYRAFIERSPFVLVATAGPEGLDCSPRGDPPGFVRVRDEKTVLIPDRRGNNRLDTLKNIVRDPRISLLFLIPGVGETIRINGTAELLADPALCQSFALDGKVPRSVIAVSLGRIYFQCQKALARARLWQAEAQVPRAELPTAGDLLQEQAAPGFDGAEYDRTYPAHMAKTIY